VVATGGGVVLSDLAWATMRRTGVVLGLSARRETLLERIGPRAASRPLLGDDPPAALEALLWRRRHLYARADATLATDALTPEVAAGGLLGLLRSLLGPLAQPGGGR
jgi:shikimate kinase